MTGLPHLATLLLDRVLAIQPVKAEIILAALAGRLGIARVRLPDGRIRAFDGDEGGQVVMVDDMSDDDSRAGYEVIAGVAVIPVYGTLIQRQLGLRPVSGLTGYNAIRANFCRALDDPAVRAIAFDIDSPGGDCAGLFDLSDEICNARGVMPIWAILNESAASAAFAIAAACDKVTAPRTGYSGSIGVIMLHADLSGALAKEGITVTVLTYGARKADGNPVIPLSDPARERLQADIDTVGELFVSTIARYRGISTKRVRGQQAAVYLGRAACAAGLVDAVMSPAEAFAALVELAGAHKPPASSDRVRVPTRDEMRGQGPGRAARIANFRRMRRLGIFPPMAS